VGVLSQVAFEATAGKQAGVLAVRGDEHERAGFTVRRSCGVHEHAHRNGIACGALTVEKRKERT